MHANNENRQVFLELSSSQAATALKRHLDAFNANAAAGTKKFIASYHFAQNPYKTLPKDVPNRRDGNRQDTFSNRGGTNNFRGGRGNYNNNTNFNNRGGGMGGFSQNRNFSNPSMNMGMQGGYGANPMGGFQGGMQPMNNFGGFNRGGMMGGMRGGMPTNRGRGGMNMMGGMQPMGGMNMMGGGMPNMAMMGGMGNMGGKKPSLSIVQFVFPCG